MFPANFVPDFIQMSQKETTFKRAWLQLDVDISMTCPEEHEELLDFTKRVCGAASDVALL